MKSRIWNRMLGVLLWARAGLGVRAHIQAGKDQSVCTRCLDGMQVCHLPNAKSDVRVC